MPELVLFIRVFQRNEDWRRSYQGRDATLQQKRLLVVRCGGRQEPCFSTRFRRSNSESDSCRRCSGRRPRSLTSSASVSLVNPARIVRTMTISTFSTKPTNQSLPYVPRVTLEEENVKRELHQSNPSAPSPGLVLFNSEDRSDVVFLVGQKPDQWRFPGHSFILSPASPVFESIIARSKCKSATYPENIIRLEQQQAISQTEISHTEPYSSFESEKELRPIEILDTPPDVFQNILCFIYTNSIPSLSVTSALRLLEAAGHYQVTTLCATCLAFLLDNVNRETVLEIFSQLRQQRRPPSESLIGNESDPPSPIVDELCTNLQNEVIFQCLNVIDDNAEFLLKSEAFENLSQDTVNVILSRDSIRVRSELAVYYAAMSWACQECKRRQLELKCENMRDSLGKILYCIRFLSMNAREFNLGPVSSGVLPDDEKDALLARLNGNFSNPLPDNLQGRKMNIRRHFPRSTNYGAVPKTGKSVGRSSSFTSGSTSPTESDRRLRRKPSSVDGKKNSTSKKFFQGLGDIFVCIIQLLD